MVFVTGPTCSGKTTLARRLSEHFGLPPFHKDGFKEALFEVAYPAGDFRRGDDAGITREYSQLLGRFSLACLEVALEQCARSGTDAVFEANFTSALFSPRLSAIRERCSFVVVQAHLRSQPNGEDDEARAAALFERFLTRERGDRHPGHGAWRGGERYLHENRPEFARQLLRLHDEDEPLAMADGDALFAFDTTDFQSVDFTPFFREVGERLATRKRDRED
jgi:hypothetical protein